jgi:hypothetical protein
MTGVRYPIEMVKGMPMVVAPRNRCQQCRLAAAGSSRSRGPRARTFVVDMTRARSEIQPGWASWPGHKRAVAEGELRLVIPTSAMVRRVFAFTGIDRVSPTAPAGPGPGTRTGTGRRFPATAPATTPQARDAHRTDRPLPSPGASTSPAWR